MYYLDLQVASNERKACLRLFLELSANFSASLSESSMLSCFATNLRTSTIWKREELLVCIIRTTYVAYYKSKWSSCHLFVRGWEELNYSAKVLNWMEF